MDVDLGAVASFLEAWGYAALLLLLVLNGIGSPIPEDLLLFATGYLVYVGVFQWPAALAIAMSGVVVSDVMLYSAGRHLAWRSTRWPDSRLLSAKRLQRATRWFARLGNGAVFVARLVPGTRALVFATAGARALPIRIFLRYDLVGAAVWVPMLLVIGYTSGNSVGELDNAIRLLWQGAFWMIAAALVLAWMAWGREVSKL